MTTGEKRPPRRVRKAAAKAPAEPKLTKAEALDIAIEAVNAATVNLAEKAQEIVDAAVRRERKRRIVSFVLAGLVILVVLGTASWRYRHDQYTQCVSSKNSRAEIRQGFKILADQVVPDETASTEEKLQKAAFLLNIETGLPDRTCELKWPW